MAVSNAVLHVSINGGPATVVRPGSDKDRATPPDTVIWRYMPKAFFFDLLQTRSAFFTRLTVHQSTDPFEGALPYGIAAIHESIVKSKGGDVALFVQERERFIKKFLRVVLVNCWHQSGHENRAMWDRYGKGEEAIAMVTTFQDLKAALPPRADVGHVDYVDFASEEIGVSSNPSHRAFQKICELEDEKEVRAVLFDYPKGQDDVKPDTEIKIDPKTDIGYRVEVNLEHLIHRVVISPDAPGIIDEVRAEVERNQLSVDVVKSTISRKPAY